MGFLDKVKTQAEQIAKQGQDKLDDQKAKRKADGLLRSLGAWYYAIETDRDEGKGAAEMVRIVAELHAHEAEHGPLGGSADDEPDEPAQPAAPDGPPPVAPVSAPVDPTIPPPPTGPPPMQSGDAPPPPPPPGFA